MKFSLNSTFPTWLGSIILLIAAGGTAYGISNHVNAQLKFAAQLQDSRVQQLTSELNYYKLKAAELEKKDDTPTPPPSVPKTQTFNEKHFSFITPVGWKKVNHKTSTPQEAAKYEILTYEDDKGNRFIVTLGGGHADNATDFFWYYRVAADKKSIKSIQENKKCTSGANNGGPYPYCSDGDGKLTVTVDPDQTNLKIGSFGWFNYFTLENTKKETGVDLQVFRDILLSFKAK